MKVSFEPAKISVDVEGNTKILIAAKQGKVPIRFGCASCRCGTCAVKIAPPNHCVEMKPTERDLLTRMKLPTDGSVRLACQAKVTGDIDVDVSFQDTYSPDDGDEFV